MGYNIGNPLQARTGGYGSNLRVLLWRHDAWNAYDGYLACPSSGIPRARVFGGVGALSQASMEPQKERLPDSAFEKGAIWSSIRGFMFRIKAQAGILRARCVELRKAFQGCYFTRV